MPTFLLKLPESSRIWITESSFFFFSLTYPEKNRPKKIFLNTFLSAFTVCLTLYLWEGKFLKRKVQLIHYCDVFIISMISATISFQLK